MTSKRIINLYVDSLYCSYLLLHAVAKIGIYGITCRLQYNDLLHRESILAHLPSSYDHLLFNHINLP